MHIVVQAGIITSAIIFFIYALFLAAGYVAQTPIPATYIFRYLPVDAYLNRYEAYFPFAIMSLAILMAGQNWIVLLHNERADVRRQIELKIVSLWQTLGFFSTAGIFYLFCAAATWSGNISAQDFLGASIGGLVPYSDANGYLL